MHISLARDKVAENPAIMECCDEARLYRISISLRTECGICVEGREDVQDVEATDLWGMKGSIWTLINEMKGRMYIFHQVFIFRRQIATLLRPQTSLFTRN